MNFDPTTYKNPDALDQALIASQVEHAFANQKKTAVEAAIAASGNKPKTSDVALLADLERQIMVHEKFQKQAATHMPILKTAHSDAQQKTAQEKADADAAKQVETDTKDRVIGRDEAAALLTNKDDVRKGMTPEQRMVYDATASGTKKLEGFKGNFWNTLNPLGLGYIFNGGDDAVRAQLTANQNIDNADAPGGRKLTYAGAIDPTTGLPGPSTDAAVTLNELISAVATGQVEGVQAKLKAANELPQPVAGSTAKEQGAADTRGIVELEGSARKQLARNSNINPDLGNGRLFTRHASALAQVVAGGIMAYKGLAGKEPDKLEDRINTAWDPVAGPALFGSTIEKIRTQLANAPGGKLDVLKKGEEKFQKDLDRHMIGIFGGSDLSSKTKDEMRKRLHGVDGKFNSAAGMIAGISDNPEIGKLTRAALDAHSSEDKNAFQSSLMDINQALAAAKVDPKQPVYLGGLGEDVGLSGHGVTYAVPDSAGGWKLVNAPFKGDMGGKLSKLRIKDQDEQDVTTLGSSWTDKEYESLPFGKDAINQYVKEQEASDLASTSGTKPKSYRPAKR